MNSLTECGKIRLLNDNFRSTFIGGRLLLTIGVSELPIDVKAKALLTVKSLKDFTIENDPHNEHDFGSFEIAGEKFYWKIDYYDSDCRYGSEDPGDPEKTTRVLTIMLAEEY
ncbi:MAG: DUF3768 domain-containing protein [Candidatus Sulfotelmatobacter sp.]